MEGTVGPVYQTQLLYEQAQIFDESRLRAMFGDLATDSERADQLLAPICTLPDIASFEGYKHQSVL